MVTVFKDNGSLCDPREVVRQVRSGDIDALDRMTRC